MTILHLINALLYLNALVVIALLIYEERDPSSTLAWAVVLIAFPGIGLIFYLFFGRDWRSIALHDRARAEAERLGDAMMRPVYDRWRGRAAAELADRPPSVARVSTALATQCGTRPLPATELEIIGTGAEKFALLMRDIEAATSSVHLEYFIWESDGLTGQLCDLLARKVADGVEVRVLYDWGGSLFFSKQQLRRLARAGAEVHADSARWTRVNYRNHRKIAVIDGAIAYTGGMNVGQEYVDGGRRFKSWRDTHLRFGGPLATEMQRMFAGRWYRVTRRSLFSAEYFPELGIERGGVVWTQLGHSGPETRWQALRNTFMLAITSAEKSVRVQSPYFVPDEPILEALVTQALAGVDVEFMMTGVPDKLIAFNAAYSYIDDLTEVGGRMYHYDAGFFHPKTMTIDDEIAVVGTTNFDFRSFALHDELSVFLYDAGAVARLDRLFDADVAKSHLVRYETVMEFGRVRRFANGLARLASRLL
jgi:cardiolipin synthase